AQHQERLMAIGGVVITVLLSLDRQLEPVVGNAFTDELLPGRFAMVATARTYTVLGGGHVLDLVVTGVFGAHEAMIKTGQHLADVAARHEIGQGIAPAAQAIIGGTNTQRIERLAQRLNKIS